MQEDNKNKSEYALKLKKDWEKEAGKRVRVKDKWGNYYTRQNMSPGQIKALKKLIKPCESLGEGHDGYLYFRKKV